MIQRVFAQAEYEGLIDLMSDYDLIIDPEFKRLLPELSKEEYDRLQESILTEGCRDALILWGRTIVDGHNRYQICKTNGIAFRTRQIDFSSREEALRWICLNQIGRRNITPELLKYQIGKRYNVEKRMSAHNPSGKNQYTEVASDILMQPHRDNRLGRAGAIGREYNVSHFAVHTYKDIANAVDRIAEKDKRLADRYLAGKIRIKKDDLVAISGMSDRQVRSLTSTLLRGGKTVCRTQDLLDATDPRDLEKEAAEARERRKTASQAGTQVSVKNMPTYDPDGEVASLSLTIPSWNSSIDRVFNHTDLHEISDKARTQLKSELLALRNSVDIILLAIEEASDNG